MLLYKQKLLNGIRPATTHAYVQQIGMPVNTILQQVSMDSSWRFDS